ncbi:hypothetical protein Sj15T_28070 [Sphingobium sp. TA15]|uniref:Uncharacterized protein n=1 Tax=Sphingobium chlorophenolicum L-1 TaxID=690566 RepID=F6EXC7_SPHCR|nr:hypothetical protein Sphch_2287 [Sphingobium chlorophenolicum L-1]BDD67786.1 hypothetical protein Sj15T_28070 [Sphingobium sp. TA15]
MGLRDGTILRICPVGVAEKRPFSRSFKVTTALLRRRLWQVKGIGRSLGPCPAEPYPA